MIIESQNEETYITLKQKSRAYGALIEPTVLYGTESGLTMKIKVIFDMLLDDHECLRTIMGVLYHRQTKSTIKSKEIN